MKNFPHQFNDLEKLFQALSIANQLIDNKSPLTDENFGEQLTRKGIYTYRNRTLSISQFIEEEKKKPKASRGYLTVSRDIRRFFELLGFITVLDEEKNSRVTITGKQLLTTTSVEEKLLLWKNALLQLGLESEGEISHPYRILLKIVNKYPGIETQKLMLALEAKNDSEIEFERITTLARLTIEQLIKSIGISGAVAANAVKILPGVAEQLNDIKRISNKAYPVSYIAVTEDDISTEIESESPFKDKVVFREVSAEEIAKDPTINTVSTFSIDISDAIKARQKRLTEHQEVVRLLATLNQKHDIQLFEGKFDCLGVKGDKAILYEVKTILQDAADQEKQAIKGVGQLKYYKHSIVKKKVELTNIKEILVFSHYCPVKFECTSVTS